MTMKERSVVEEYFAALERLKHGRPGRVPKGTRITNDAVALEAGRGKGSIKKSRPIFTDLLLAIRKAAADEAQPQLEQRDSLARAKSEAAEYRLALEAALGREVSLLKELYETKLQLSLLSGERVIPIRRNASRWGDRKQTGDRK